MCIVIFVAITCLMQVITADDPDIKKELSCENENAVLECPRGYAIEIINALYGKQDKSICTFPGNNVDNCVAANSLDIVKLKCNRKQICKVKASNSVFGDPCPHIIKYLEVSYKCKAGDILTKIACEDQSVEIKCPSNHYLWITNAWYGRRDQKKCNQGPAPGPNPIMHNHCNSNSALSIIETRCDFLSVCAIEAKNDVFGDPCSGTHKYFEVDYQCFDRGSD